MRQLVGFADDEAVKSVFGVQDGTRKRRRGRRFGQRIVGRVFGRFADGLVARAVHLYAALQRGRHRETDLYLALQKRL